MIFMRANPLLRPLEGVGPEISTFLGPNGIHSLRSMPFQGPSLPMTLAPGNESCPHQNHYVPRHINNINSYYVAL
jgi:hypothetical protein